MSPFLGYQCWCSFHDDSLPRGWGHTDCVGADFFFLKTWTEWIPDLLSVLCSEKNTKLGWKPRFFGEVLQSHPSSCLLGYSPQFGSNTTFSIPIIDYLLFSLAVIVPWPGMEPKPPALGTRNLSHWTTRKVSKIIFNSFIIFHHNEYLIFYHLILFPFVFLL